MSRTQRPIISVANGCKAGRIGVVTLRKLVTSVAAAEGRSIAAVDVAVVGADEIAELNERYLRQPGPTDVLSFDLSDDDAPGVSAQIVVCGDVAAEAGPANGNTVDVELQLYVIHGLLHLMGYDDTTPRAAATMRARQEELLRGVLGERVKKKIKKGKK